MDCSTVRDMMLEFVEGTLPPKVAEGVKEHIESCPACMEALEKQSSRTRALQSLSRVKAPDQWDEISRTIKHRHAWRPAARYGLLAAILALALVAVVVALAYILPAMRGPSAPGKPASAARAISAPAKSPPAGQGTSAPESPSP